MGDAISFSGGVADDEQGPLPASALQWDLVLLHCHDVDHCHEHPVQSWTGVDPAPSLRPTTSTRPILELRLTAKDDGGLSVTTSSGSTPRRS